MSKTLLQKLQTPASLQKAWKNLNKSNRSSRGLSTETIESFAARLSENLKNIRKQLRTGGHQFSKIRGSIIVKKSPEGKIKKRGIRVAEIQDRVVQRGIAQLIEPILSKKYKLDNGLSFAYLEEKGIRDAIRRMIVLYKEGRPIVLEADIKKFFDNVDREKLLSEMIFPVLPDDTLNQLIKESLEQELGNWDAISPDDVSLFPSTGIPQGGVLSPLFANVYLSSFDQEFKKAGLGLVRYADDFVVMCKNSEEASRAYSLSQSILEVTLKLKMHELLPDNSGKTRILKVTQDKLEFLGLRFNGKRLWPSEGKVKRLKTRIQEITEYADDKTILTVLSDLKGLLDGWFSAYSFTDVAPIIPELESYLRVRLGVCAYKMGWNPIKDNLSDKQRLSSGIKDLNIALKKPRGSFKEADLLFFSEYWS